MYYGAGLLSTVDRYPERRISRPVPAPPSTRGRRGRPAERGSGRGMHKARRGRVRDARVNDSNDTVSPFNPLWTFLVAVISSHNSGTLRGQWSLKS